MNARRRPIIRLPKGPITRATVRTSGALALRLVVQAGTLLILARMLGAEQFGAYAGIAALAILLGTLATFGTHLVLLGEASKDPVRRHTVLPYALPTTLVAGSILFVLYLGLAFWIVHRTGINGTVILAIGAAELLLQPIIGLASAEHQAHGRIARSQLLISLTLVLRLLVALIIWGAQPPNPLLLFAHGYLIATALSLGIALWHLPEPWPSARHWRHPTRREIKHTAGYAALNITAAGPSELDKTLAIKLLPLGAAGVYAAGARVISAITLPVIALMLAALPRLFRESLDTTTHSTRLMKWLFGAALAYSLALSTLLWVVAPLIGALFGPKYTGIEEVIRWLTLAVPGMVLRITAGSVLMANGKPWMRASIEVAGLLVLGFTALGLTAGRQTQAMPIALACGEWTMAAAGIMAMFSMTKEDFSNAAKH